MHVNITADSRKIKPGDIFVAEKGYTVDGHDYIEKAIEMGASKIICNHGNYNVETIITDDTIGYMSDYLNEKYGPYLKKMKLIGITGTNGKTTTASLIHNALNKLNIKCAYIGTIGFYINKKVRSLPNTTPSLDELYSMFMEAYDAGCEYVVMEVSSQGIMNRRVEGINFDYAIFTNLTQDHLDFHKTMGNYALAKQRLFYQLKPGGKAIVNKDDSYKEYYLLEQNNNITFGLESGNYIAENIRMTSRGSKFRLRTSTSLEDIETPLIGDYNIYNVLIVIAVLMEIGLPINQVKTVISSLKAPAGRMDTIAYKNNSIVIDYAHTPDAIKNILDTMNGVNPNHVYVIFGCTGDRDRLKRPIMTKLVTDLSDYAIITIDDPHNEEPNQIVNDMLDGLNNSNYEVILDRGRAIKKGIDLLDNNDILLILGKGHEEAIIIKDKKIPFNDKEVAANYIIEKETCHE